MEPYRTCAEAGRETTPVIVRTMARQGRMIER
jgi:hypothetical protein